MTNNMQGRFGRAVVAALVAAAVIGVGAAPASASSSYTGCITFYQDPTYRSLHLGSIDDDTWPFVRGRAYTLTGVTGLIDPIGCSGNWLNGVKSAAYNWQWSTDPWSGLPSVCDTDWSDWTYSGSAFTNTECVRAGSHKSLTQSKVWITGTQVNSAQYWLYE